MPRSVYDIDLRALVVDGYVLGQDRDTTFALQVVVIQDQLFRLVAELRLLLFDYVRGVQHLVHERCFAVVHMRNNCYVSYVLHILYIYYSRAHKRTLLQISVQNYYKKLEYARKIKKIARKERFFASIPRVG